MSRIPRSLYVPLNYFTAFNHKVIFMLLAQECTNNLYSTAPYFYATVCSDIF